MSLKSVMTPEIDHFNLKNDAIRGSFNAVLVRVRVRVVVYSDQLRIFFRKFSALNFRFIFNFGVMTGATCGSEETHSNIAQ